MHHLHLHVPTQTQSRKHLWHAVYGTIALASLNPGTQVVHRHMGYQSNTDWIIIRANQQPPSHSCPFSPKSLQPATQLSKPGTSNTMHILKTAYEPQACYRVEVHTVHRQFRFISFIEIALRITLKHPSQGQVRTKILSTSVSAMGCTHDASSCLSCQLAADKNLSVPLVAFTTKKLGLITPSST